MIGSYIERAVCSLGRRLKESPLKDSLRQLRTHINIMKNREFYHDEGSHYKLRFMQGLLDGQEVMFPKPCDPHVSICYKELPGYFQLPLLSKGSVAFDCGAFPGDWTVIASRMVGMSGHVYAFEPHPQNRDYLVQMLKVNKVSNVTVLPHAVYDTTGTGVLSCSRAGSALRRYLYSDSTVDVDTLSLDEFAHDKKVDFIKMDIEGAEVAALKGAQRILHQMRPALAIASYHTLPDGTRSADLLENLLADYGYASIRTVFPEHLTTYAYQ
jgi:FkbM family methyltransferase